MVKDPGNRIAVLYAEGDIVDGEAPEREVGGETLAAKLADLRRDEEVKAVVLRVNSPGGSALASEVIWHEMELLRAEKPVVVSMGNVAASGGYYIACPADVILASPTTITGSIGVFGLLFNAGQGLKDKLGVTVDVAKTNPSADIGLPFREVSPAERDYLQHNVERVYAGFVKHVAEGRNLTEAQVDSIGGGRVWSGVSALDNGLINAGRPFRCDFARGRSGRGRRRFQHQRTEPGARPVHTHLYAAFGPGRRGSFAKRAGRTVPGVCRITEDPFTAGSAGRNALPVGNPLNDCRILSVPVPERGFARHLP